MHSFVGVYFRLVMSKYIYKYILWHYALRLCRFIASYRVLFSSELRFLFSFYLKGKDKRVLFPSKLRGSYWEFFYLIINLMEFIFVHNETKITFLWKTHFWRYFFKRISVEIRLHKYCFIRKQKWLGCCFWERKNIFDYKDGRICIIVYRRNMHQIQRYIRYMYLSIYVSACIKIRWVFIYVCIYINTCIYIYVCFSAGHLFSDVNKYMYIYICINIFMFLDSNATRLFREEFVLFVSLNSFFLLKFRVNLLSFLLFFVTIK